MRIAHGRLVVLGLWLLGAPAAAAEPLAHWQEGPAKQAIVDFVQAVTTPNSPTFVNVEARLAAFDNDGTLWAEQPYYFPVLFALQQLRAAAAQHPDWIATEPFRSLLQDPNSLAPLSTDVMNVLQQRIFAGQTPEAFRARVATWLAEAQHPQLHQPFHALTYVPMLELLAYLRAHDFTVVLSSGAETEFVRSVGAALYQVPAKLAIGSDMLMVAALQADNSLQLLRTPGWSLPFNERAGKAINLQRRLAQRPILAFGNSNGDIELLQYATEGSRPALGMVLHHDDAAREFAYTANAEQVVQIAAERGWHVVSMQRDFRQVFAFQP